MSAAHPQTPDPAPWIRDSPHILRLTGSYRRAPRGRKTVGHEIARRRPHAGLMVIGALPPWAGPGRQTHPISPWKGRGAHAPPTVCLRPIVAWAGLASLCPRLRVAEPVFPPGLRIGIEPPVDMNPSTRFPGFEDTEHKAIIAILDLPLSAYQELETAAFNNIQQDLQQPKRESFPFESGIGFLISGTAPTKWRRGASLVAAGTGRWRIRPRPDGADQCGSAGERAFGLFGCNRSQGTGKRHVQAGADPGTARLCCPSSSAIWRAFARRSASRAFARPGSHRFAQGR